MSNRPFKMYSRQVSQEHILAALEGYMHSLGMIDDNEIITNIKRHPQTGEFEVLIEKEQYT